MEQPEGRGASLEKRGEVKGRKSAVQASLAEEKEEAAEEVLSSGE